MIPYEEGKACAMRGGNDRENPFIGTDDSASFIRWHRGFMDCRIPDPDCSRCHGTGEIEVDASKAGYGMVTFQCECNLSPEKRISM